MQHTLPRTITTTSRKQRHPIFVILWNWVQQYFAIPNHTSIEVCCSTLRIQRGFNKSTLIESIESNSCSQLFAMHNYNKSPLVVATRALESTSYDSQQFKPPIAARHMWNLSPWCNNTKHKFVLLFITGNIMACITVDTNLKCIDWMPNHRIWTTAQRCTHLNVAEPLSTYISKSLYVIQSHLYSFHGTQNRQITIISHYERRSFRSGCKTCCNHHSIRNANEIAQLQISHTATGKYQATAKQFRHIPCQSMLLRGSPL